jgi:hypothetical protein
VQENRETTFVELPMRNLDHRVLQFIRGREQSNAVDLQENQSRRGSNTLVSIDKRLGFRQVKRISRRYIEKVAAGIPEGVLCRGKSGIHKTGLPHAILPAMFGQGAGMKANHL